MKKEENISSPNEIAGRLSFFRMLVIYLVICSVGVALLLIRFDGLIRNHDKRLTGDICSLVTEKMNNSIRYMTNSVANMSAGLSAQNINDLGAQYDILSRNNGDNNYISVGFIGEDGTVYDHRRS